MCFQPKKCHSIAIPKVCLNGEYIKLVSEHKYLHILMRNTNTDDIEMAKQIYNVYAEDNTLIKIDSKCTVDVKSELFYTFRSTLFGCQLWSDYKQQSHTMLLVAYNRLCCLLMNIMGIVSMSQILLHHKRYHVNITVSKRIIGFMQRLAHSEN